MCTIHSYTHAFTLMLMAHRFPFLRLSVIFLALGLSACSSAKSGPDMTEPLVPMHHVMDPSDAQLDESVRKTLANMQAPVYSGYEFRRIDLNKDGRREALVLFKTPYGYWCGTHGCTMLVMEAHNDHFTLHSSIQPVRAPVYSTDTETNGWRDIIIRVSGRWDEAKDVAAKYDGTKYPLDPADIEPASGEELANISYLFR
jgi:hypothetical protein